MINPRILLLASVVVLSAAFGCSSDKWVGQRPRVVPVSGRVLFNGQPLEDAHVTFTNPTANRSAYGRTNAEGRFTLTTFTRNDGAVPGHQEVSVSKVQGLKPADPGVDRTTTTKTAPAPERRWLIPSHYGNMATSGLTAEVPEDGATDLVLELQGTAEK